MSGRTGQQLAGLVVLAAVGGVLALRRRRHPPVPRRTGTSSSGMDYVVLGDGRRTLLSIPGGPGSDIPTGPLGRLTERESRPYVDAGYAVWTVTRRRNMPPGHTVADMADDYADFIRGRLGGSVDVVLGTSYGGMIAMHLAAQHPGLVGSVVLAGDDRRRREADRRGLGAPACRGPARGGRRHAPGAAPARAPAGRTPPAPRAGGGGRLRADRRRRRRICSSRRTPSSPSTAGTSSDGSRPPCSSSAGRRTSSSRWTRSGRRQPPAQTAPWSPTRAAATWAPCRAATCPGTSSPGSGPGNARRPPPQRGDGRLHRVTQSANSRPFW